MSQLLRLDRSHVSEVQSLPILLGVWSRFLIGKSFGRQQSTEGKGIASECGDIGQSQLCPREILDELLTGP